MPDREYYMIGMAGTPAQRTTTSRAVFREATKGMKLEGFTSEQAARKTLESLPDYVRDKCCIYKYTHL